MKRNLPPHVARQILGIGKLSGTKEQASKPRRAPLERKWITDLEHRDVALHYSAPIRIERKA